MQFADYESKTLTELQKIAKESGIDNYTRYRKRELIYELLKVLATQEGRIFSQGVLETLAEGYGFLRVDNYEPGPDDVYVSNSQIRRFHLRTGDLVAGQVRPPKDNERYFSLLKTQAVNYLDPDSYQERTYFEEL
ncbi:MAG TPA: transcription termination factor Rho, partial [Firmicutes bacterium]|nr:transcription termination factor Rho [Bacillota bacterium]